MPAKAPDYSGVPFTRPVARRDSRNNPPFGFGPLRGLPGKRVWIPLQTPLLRFGHPSALEVSRAYVHIPVAHCVPEGAQHASRTPTSSTTGPPPDFLSHLAATYSRSPASLFQKTNALGLHPFRGFVLPNQVASSSLATSPLGVPPGTCAPHS